MTFAGVMLKFHLFYAEISQDLCNSFTAVMQKFHSCYAKVSQVLTCSFNVVKWKFHMVCWRLASVMLEFHRCYAGAGVSLPRLEPLFQSCRLAARRHNTALKLTYNKDIKAVFKA